MSPIRLRAEWVVPVSSAPIHHGAVLVDGTRIVAVGPVDTVPAGRRERDLGGVALLPGFVDTHTHLEWSLVPRGERCGASFAAWLTSMLEHGEAMTPDDFLIAARSGAAQALRSGTTTVLDAGPSGAGAIAANELGLRAVVHLETFGRFTGDEAAERADAHAARVVALDGGLVTGGVSPHAPYTVGPDYWRALRDQRQLADRPWMTHVAESDEELAAIAGTGGPLTELFTARGSHPGHWPGEGSVVARLEQGGALHAGLVAAHCVHVTGHDIDRLARAGVTVAHCPVSNATLDVGEHPLTMARAGGLAVGLGTDSPATAGDYDIRSVADACAASTGRELDPAALLRLMTLDGARVAGRANDLGTLEPGKLADLIAIELGNGQDPLAAVLAPSRVPALVMVDGEIVVDRGALTWTDGRAIDTAAAAAQARLHG